MSKKQKQLRAFEVVQRTNCLTNQNFVLSENPEQKENKMRLCNLISEQDCQKFIDTLVDRGLLEKSSFMKHTGDKQKKTAMDSNGNPVTDKNGKPVTIIVDELEHIHLALLFKEVQTFQSVSELFFQITGKIVPPNCVAMCEYLHKNPNSEISDEQQYALMVVYQTHAGKKGATTPEIAQTLEKGQKEYSYKLYFNLRKSEHIDENRNTVIEEHEDLKFIPDFRQEPRNSEIISEFTVKTSTVHQNLYNPDRLTTYNTSIIECFRMHKEVSEMEKKRANDKKLKEQAHQFVVDISEGKIKPYEYEEKVPADVRAVMPMGVVQRAIGEYYRMRERQVKKQKLFSAPSRNVILVQGDAGSGKSTFAKQLCMSKGYEYCISSSGEHPFDEYMGEEAIILDDCRDSVFKMNDILKILDNNTTCSVHARYHNKNLCDVKMIVITTSKPIDTWYKSGLQMGNVQVGAVTGDKGEQLNQLYRRITCVYTINQPRPDGKRYVTLDEWDRNTRDYIRTKDWYWTFNVEKLEENAGKVEEFNPVEDAETAFIEMGTTFERGQLFNSPVAPSAPVPAPQTSSAVQPAQSSVNTKPAVSVTAKTNPWHPFNSPAKVDVMSDTPEHSYSMQRALLAPKHHDGFELLS